MASPTSSHHFGGREAATMEQLLCSINGPWVTCGFMGLRAFFVPFIIMRVFFFKLSALVIPVRRLWLIYDQGVPHKMMAKDQATQRCSIESEFILNAHSYTKHFYQKHFFLRRRFFKNLFNTQCLQTNCCTDQILLSRIVQTSNKNNNPWGFTKVLSTTHNFDTPKRIACRKVHRLYSFLRICARVPVLALKAKSAKC